MKAILTYVLTITLWGMTSVYGESVDSIMKKAHLVSYYQGKDGRAQILMKDYAKGASKPIKKLLYMLRLDKEDGGEQFFYTYFLRPTDIKRTTFLVHKKIKEDDFRRLYIPASDKVLPIDGSRKQDPFMGSDFSYEDVSGRHFSVDRHKLLKSEEKVFVTESVPKVKEDKIAKIIARIDMKTYIPMKVDYYGHDGKVFKSYVSQDIKVIQGFPTIMKRTMSSPLEGTKTEMLINPKKVKYDMGLDKSIFNERALKNPPMQYLK
jgi:hypothetical protein